MSESLCQRNLKATGPVTLSEPATIVVDVSRLTERDYPTRVLCGTGPGRACSAGPVTAERVLVLHSGDLGTDDLRQLVGIVVRESGRDLTGVRITTCSVPAPNELLAKALVLEHADELAPDPLSRLSTYTVEAATGRCVVVVVWADEVNPWVSRTAPKHLARVAATGFGVVRRPGWARLSSQAALSFLASARDGDSRRFPDLQVVVSVFPASRPRLVRRLMPGGYSRWVDGVFARAGVRLGDGDAAHWLVCGHVLHLAYFSPDPDVAPLVPWDLLSRAEKRGGGELS